MCKIQSSSKFTSFLLVSQTTCAAINARAHILSANISSIRAPERLRLQRFVSADRARHGSRTASRRGSVDKSRRRPRNSEYMHNQAVGHITKATAALPIRAHIVCSRTLSAHLVRDGTSTRYFLTLHALALSRPPYLRSNIQILAKSNRVSTATRIVVFVSVRVVFSRVHGAKLTRFSGKLVASMGHPLLLELRDCNRRDESEAYKPRESCASGGVFLSSRCNTGTRWHASLSRWPDRIVNLREAEAVYPYYSSALFLQ